MARVKVQGLVSRVDLNGKEGVAEKLDRSGRYVVVLDGENNERVLVKYTNLVAMHHEESTYSDMLTVNGLDYCSKHRLEICGACGCSYRMPNRAFALGGDFDTAQLIEDEEAAQNWPPLRAPTAGSPACDREPVRVKLNRKELIPNGIDPSTLSAWTLASHGPVSRMMGVVTGSKEKMALRKAAAYCKDM